jgi:hypothetical protein
MTGKKTLLERYPELASRWRRMKRMNAESEMGGPAADTDVFRATRLTGSPKAFIGNLIQLFARSHDRAFLEVVKKARREFMWHDGTQLSWIQDSWDTLLDHEGRELELAMILNALEDARSVEHACAIVASRFGRGNSFEAGTQQLRDLYYQFVRHPAAFPGVERRKSESYNQPPELL